MVTDRQSTVLRKVLVGFGDAEGPRVGPSHWEGRSCTPMSGARLLLGSVGCGGQCDAMRRTLV